MHGSLVDMVILDADSCCFSEQRERGCTGARVRVIASVNLCLPVNLMHSQIF